MPRRFSNVVIVGGGHAAGQLAASLRQLGFAGGVLIVGEEDHPPYQRPPLSKQYLKDECGLDRVYLRQQQFYAAKEVQCISGKRVVQVDASMRFVVLDDGTEIGWDTLVFATGSSNRALDIPGTDLPGVHSLRSISDCDGLKEQLDHGGRTLIVGGGYIGLEVASSCRSLGLEATVVELLDRVLARVAVPEISSYFQNLHDSNGVHIATSSVVKSIERDLNENALRVELANGQRLHAETVLIGVGIVPNVELAQESGLRCSDGILVDEYCRTDHDRIFAIGDCTSQQSQLLGRRIRLESVPNAMEQARCAAATIAGTPTPNHSIPWFWSDQYDVKFQMAGFPTEGEAMVVRGEFGGKTFMNFHLANGQLVGASAVNSPGEFLVARRLIGKTLDPKKLSDPNTELKSLV
ncbi:MAG: FAD-dependent oxidoreductase [Gammaproteobacteria bacterium]|nr:FAD-dependent oxidoreductase [Gammaproteobacteria bacterium]